MEASQDAAKLPTRPDEAEVFRETGTEARQLEMKDQLAVADALDDCAIVRARPRCFVSTPYPSPRRIDSPPAALAVTALGRVASRDRVLVGAIGAVPRRDHYVAVPELTRGGARGLPITLEQPLRRVGEVAADRVERERIQAPLTDQSH